MHRPLSWKELAVDERGNPLKTKNGKPATPENTWGFLRVDERSPAQQRSALPEHVKEAREAQERAYADAIATQHARTLARLKEEAAERLQAVVRVPSEKDKKLAAKRQREAMEAQGWRFIDSTLAFQRTRGRPAPVAKAKPTFVMPEIEEEEPLSLFEELRVALATSSPAIEHEPTAEELVEGWGKPEPVRALPEKVVALLAACPRDLDLLDLAEELRTREPDVVVSERPYDVYRELKAQLMGAKAAGDKGLVRKLAGKIGFLKRKWGFE